MLYGGKFLLMSWNLGYDIKRSYFLLYLDVEKVCYEF